VPLSGLISVEQVLMVVVLPAPFEPSNAKISPRRTSKSTPFNTSTPVKDFRKPST